MPEPFTIAPEREETANYHAFKDDELYLGLFPQDIVHRLKDESSVEGRKSALTMIHRAIQSCDDVEILSENLQKIVILVTLPLTDLNIKIVLTGLQVLHDLIDKVQERISPHLDHITAMYLERVACNKYNVKQAGMKLLMHLLSVVGPMKVLTVIMNHGLSSRKSKIREETLNVVTMTLMQYPVRLDLTMIVKNITPLLADTRQNVRQACLETCMVLSKSLGEDNLQQLVSAVASVEQSMVQKDTSMPSLMEAFEARLSRAIAPSISDDGLIEHVVNVANGKSGGDLTGADIDWILAGSGKTSTSPGTGGRKISMSGSGPLRSAGKKLPWDPKEKLPNKVLLIRVKAPIFDILYA